MITVSFKGVNYECEKALKGEDYVRLIGSNGAIIAAFEGVNNFTGFTISGGEWSTPTEEDDCPLAVVGEDGKVRKSPLKACDILTTEDKEAIDEQFEELKAAETVMVFIGTHAEYNTLDAEGKIPENTLVCLLDDGASGSSTTSVLGRALLGKMILA